MADIGQFLRPEGWGELDPFAAAALRQRWAVQPVGGRQESGFTRGFQNASNALATKAVNFPGEFLGAVAGVPPGLRREDFTDIPGTAQPQDRGIGMAAEMGMNMVGAPMFMANPATLGSGAVRDPIKVWRGGSTPLSRDKIPERIAGTGKYEFYSHTDPNIAAQYGKTSSFDIDPSGYFDARTPEGLAQWKAWGGSLTPVEKAGYKGAIYPDPHEWDVPVAGHEVVTFDPSTVRLRSDDPFNPESPGSGAVRRKPGLPMDEASRMERAQRLPTDVYHGTTSPEFEAFETNPHSFMIDRGLGPHFAKDPEVSNSFVMDRVNQVERGAKEGGRVIPARIPDESTFLQVPQRRYESGALESDQHAIEKLAAVSAYKADPAMFERYLMQARAMPEAEAKSVAADLLAGKRRMIDGFDMDLNRFINNFGGKPHNEADRAEMIHLAREALMKQGYKGLRYTNTSPMEMATAKDPTSYIVFDPKDIRSRFAAFDPAKRDSGFLLGSGATDKRTAAMVQGLQGIRAYHGSPHDFDRFDMSKIGTGEGAQAYGHGLYFAERPGVAESYRDSLVQPLVGGRPVRDVASEQPDNVIQAARRLGTDVETASKATDWRRINVINHVSSYGREARRFLKREDEKEMFDKMLASGELDFPKGKMYEVNIRANPNEMLDWDNPIASQPHVQAALPNLGWKRVGETDLGRTGESVVRAAQTNLGGPDAAMAAMRKAGIPGIRYLDQGSRAIGGGTSNYVLHRDDIIDILRKYGLAGAAPLGTLAIPPSDVPVFAQ